MLGNINRPGRSPGRGAVPLGNSQPLAPPRRGRRSEPWPSTGAPLFWSAKPPTFLETDDPDEARLAAAVFTAQWRYVHHQASDTELSSYRGLRVAGRLVETDPD